MELVREKTQFTVDNFISIVNFKYACKQGISKKTYLRGDIIGGEPRSISQGQGYVSKHHKIAYLNRKINI